MVKSTQEEKENPTEADVRMKLGTLSNELKIEYLENLIKRFSPPVPDTTKIFACRELAELYKAKGWWNNAARALEIAANTASTYREIKELWIEVAKLQIKNDDYLMASDSFKKAIEAAAPSERAKIFELIKQVHFQHAQEYEKARKQSAAVRAYEQTLRLSNLTDSETTQIKTKLMQLYEKLGKVQAAIALREQLK
jgi:tetratricopeptide (TPR) repeat protein